MNKQIRCIECKKRKETYHYPSRTNKQGVIKYGVKCIKCNDARKAIITETRLAARYDITHEEYLVFKQAANSTCQICRIEGKKLVIDHCHMSGAVRGLLCHTCNTRLGVLELLLDGNTLISSLEYLELSAQRILEKIK